MKKLIAPVAALILALTSSGCMSNGLAKFAKEVRQDTNSFRLRASGYGVVIEWDRNIASPSPTLGGAVSITPMTTLQVHPAK